MNPAPPVTRTFFFDQKPVANLTSDSIRHSKDALIERPAIRRLETFAQRVFRPPPHRQHSSAVQQLSRRPVRLTYVERQLPVVFDDVFHRPGELRDRHVVARTDVDRLRTLV